MNKLIAAALGLSLLAAPLAASAQDWRGQGSYGQGAYGQSGYGQQGYGDRGDNRDHDRRDYHRSDDRGYGQGWDNGQRRDLHRRCYIRNEAYRGRGGRIHYHRVEVCRR